MIKPMSSGIAVGTSYTVLLDQNSTYLVLLVHLFVVGRLLDFGKLGSIVPVMKIVELISSS